MGHDIARKRPSLKQAPWPWGHRQGLSGRSVPSPPNPTTRFLTLGYAHGWRNDTLDIKVTTDIDCHLWCRYTDSPLRIHLTERDDRGLTTMKTPDYCFVKWIEIEEDESGDHKHHIFHIPNVSPDSIRWFYLRGTVAEKVSLSVTTVIEVKHHKEQEVQPLWEPWAKTITDHHPWKVWDPYGEYGLTISQGLLHFVTFGILDNMLQCKLPEGRYPLIDDQGRHLHFYGKCTHWTGDLVKHMILYHIRTRKGHDLRWIEPWIHRGNYWGPVPFPHSGDDYRSVFDYGMAPTPIDIYEEWLWGRLNWGQDPDPTGWWCYVVDIALESIFPSEPKSVTNDFVHIYYPDPGSTFKAYAKEFFIIRKELNAMITLGIYDESQTLEGEVKLIAGIGIILIRHDDENAIEIKAPYAAPSAWSKIDTQQPTLPAATTISFTDIPADYQMLRITGFLKKQAGGPATLTVRFNADSENNYHRQILRGEGASASAFANQGTFAHGGLVNAFVFEPWEATIQNINAEEQRAIHCRSGFPDTLYLSANRWTTQDRITRIDVAVPGGHQLDPNSTLVLEGATLT